MVPGVGSQPQEARRSSQGPPWLITVGSSFLGCSVESSDVNWKKKKSGGIKIICQSEMRDFSAMAFITDHVNSLIDQWFPGKRMFLNQVFAHVNVSLRVRVGLVILGAEVSPGFSPQKPESS